MDKRLNFPNGEIGITNDELDLMPNSNQNALHGINEGLGEGVNYIVSGVSAVINAGTNVIVQDGYVFLDGKMLKVDSATIPSTVGDLYEFQKVTVNNVVGWDRDYRDATTHNVYEKNRAVPVNVTPITSLDVTGNTLVDVLKSIIQAQSDFNIVDTADPGFIKNQPDFVTFLLQGSFDVGQIGAGIVGTLYPVQGGITTAQKTIDGSGQEVVTITFPSIGTANYQVVVSTLSNVDPLLDNDVTNAIDNKTATSFRISLASQADGDDDVTMVISLIPLDLT